MTRPLFAYVGSFTTAERKARGDGITLYHVDRASGDWHQVQRVGDLVNPSFLAVGGGRFLYSVHGDRTEIHAFAIDPESGRLSMLGAWSSGGKNSVDLAIDRSGRWIAVANYASGTVSVVPIAGDGALADAHETVRLDGAPGPHRVEQASSHPHGITFDPARRFFFVPDKGLDRIFGFRIEERTGRLIPAEPASVATRAGAGPRHLAFHPRLPCAYVVNELDSTVTSYAYDGETGALEPRQIVATLPTSFTGDNTGSEIAVARSGRFLYASNRGHDSIAAFAIADDGLLSPLAWEPTQGSTPRFFTLDPEGARLYALNEQGDSIVEFRVDAESGRLSPTGRVIASKSPACLVFL